jgi:outer membrane receptor protein involved in Fe transport
LEFEAWYQSTKRLSFTFLYAQFDGKITGTSATNTAVLGRELPRAPEKSGNLLVNYKIDGDGWLGGTRWTLGMNYRNDTWLDTGLGANTLERRSDGGAVLFMAASKEVKLANKRSLLLRLNVGNITNRTYISEGFTFGEPRMIRFATDYRF